LGLETRQRGGLYFYRKVREGGRVVSEYAGSGAIGALYAALDGSTRAAQAAERAERRAQVEAERAAERDARQLAAECQELAALALLAAGYHRHKRQWRKRRYQPMGITGAHARLGATLQEQARAELQRRDAAKRVAVELPPLPAPGDYSAEARRAIMARCNRADATPEDVAALRTWLQANPQRLEGGGMLRQALDNELRKMQTTALGRELIDDDLLLRRRALGYDTAPALERPLIDHLLLCETRLGVIEQGYTHKWGDSMSLETARFWEGRLNAAQRRYLQAVETLARVRRVRVELMKIAPDGSAAAVAVEKPGR
jgi:hypothetical protein